MGIISFSTRAEKDIDSIFRYIAMDSIYYAERFVRSLILSTNRLIDMPKSGRKVPEFDNLDLREIIFKNYRIIYRIKGNENVEILSVHHSAKELMEI